MSPRLAHVRPLNAGTSFAISLNKTFDGQETVLASDVENQVVQEIPFRRAHRPGGSTAFMNFCTRPLVFVNVPRFSACAQPGNT